LKIFSQHIGGRTWIATEAAVDGLGFASILGDETPRVFTTIDRQLGKQAEKTLTGTAFVSRERPDQGFGSV
jgi:hypothetical protein